MQYNLNVNPEDKAGYNQAAKITELLAMLRSTFVSSMMENDFSASIECCRSVIDIISGKVNDKLIIKINEMIYEIEKWLQQANLTYEHSGNRYYLNGETRKVVKRNIEFLWRKIEKIQDEYGYGMRGEDKSGL
jgi:hypothetical protein